MMIVFKFLLTRIRLTYITFTAAFILSLITLTTVNFTKLSNLNGQAKPASNYRRIQRFFAPLIYQGIA